MKLEFSLREIFVRKSANRPELYIESPCIQEKDIFEELVIPIFIALYNDESAPSIRTKDRLDNFFQDKPELHFVRIEI